MKLWAMPVGLSSTLGSALIVIVVFYILSFPLRLLIVYSKNYQIAMRCRIAADWLLVGIIVVVLMQTLGYTVQLAPYLNPDKETFWAVNTQTMAALMTIVPYYLIVVNLVNRSEFYSEKHVDCLDYFILYLRNFKSDRKKGKAERRLMKSLKRLYFPFAIGRPDEFMPPQGAKRIYVGENWKEVVIRLQGKAPLILQRVNASENFLWEFDQCVQGNYLKKVIFWVANLKEYEQFRGYVAMKYQFLFPDLSSYKSKELLFYYLPDGDFRVYPLSGIKAYRRFAGVYLKEHPDHVSQYNDYFYGRRGRDLWRLLFSPVYDPKVMPGINRWSWVGFFMPDFFIICHTITYRIIIYLLFTSLPVLLLPSLPLAYMLVFLISIFAMGKNGRTLSWLCYKWESVEYFDKQFKRGNILAVILGVSRFLIWGLITFWLIFNPFGWDIPHYWFAVW